MISEVTDKVPLKVAEGWWSWWVMSPPISNLQQTNCDDSLLYGCHWVRSNYLSPTSAVSWWSQLWNFNVSPNCQTCYQLETGMFPQSFQYCMIALNIIINHFWVVSCFSYQWAVQRQRKYQTNWSRTQCSPSEGAVWGPQSRSGWWPSGLLGPEQRLLKGGPHVTCWI